jgi:hypothetical protein
MFLFFILLLIGLTSAQECEHIVSFFFLFADFRRVLGQLGEKVICHINCSILCLSLLGIWLSLLKDLHIELIIVALTGRNLERSNLI